MAKKTVSEGCAPTYAGLMTNIRKGAFAPIYLLQGEESWFADSLASAIKKHALSEDDCDFNLSTYYGADVDLDTAIAMAQSYPVMAPRRVVMLREMQAMRDAKRSLERLVPYATRPSSATVLVITFNGDSLGATHPLVKAIKQSGGVVLTSGRVAEWHLTKHIASYCKDNNLTITGEAASMIAEYIGADLSRIFATIDKLAAALPKGGRSISADLVERLTGYSKDFNNNELLNALSAKNYARCMQIVDYFRRNASKNPVQITTAFIFNFFSQLTLCYWSPDKSLQGLMRYVPKVSESRVKLLSRTMPNYNARACINIIHHIRRFDAASKGIGSQQNEHDLLQELIFKIFSA